MADLAWFVYDRLTRIIYGVGDTPGAARADAETWVPTGDRTLLARVREMPCSRCTRALADAVNAYSGEVRWRWASTARVIADVDDRDRVGGLPRHLA